jgi:paraquat-inducible protein A
VPAASACTGGALPFAAYLLEEGYMSASSTVVECRDCGLIQRAPWPAALRRLECARCDARLEGASFGSPTWAGLCTCAAFALLWLALRNSVFELHLLGRYTHADVLGGPRALDAHGFGGLSLAVTALLAVAPLVRLVAFALAAVGARMQRPAPGWFLPLAFARQLRPWAMIDVYLLAGLVCYVRLAAWANVSTGRAIALLLALVWITMAAEAALSPRALWAKVPLRHVSGRAPSHSAATSRRIACHRCGLVQQAADGDKCRRCTGPLHARKPNAMVATTATLLAATLLCIPANVLPVMTMVRFGRAETDTIFSGVLELVHSELWGLATLIFVASIVVPCLKIVVLASLLFMTRARSTRYLKLRTRAYRVVSALGRWSLVDVFAVTLLVSLVHVGKLALVLPRDGALAFCGVVILTMIATELFDPRQMWDAARANSSAEAE